MAAGDFNQIPEHCLGICELDQADVDKHHIVLSLNCAGASQGAYPMETIQFRDGEVVAIDENTSSALGRAACTNRGLKLWLQDRKEQFNGTTQ